MEFQTLGLGSFAACSWVAATAISSNSRNSEEHAGHVLRCARWSNRLPSSTSAKLCCSSTQFITSPRTLLRPNLHRGILPPAQVTFPSLQAAVRMSFRASVFCAARNLGEPREASRFLRRNTHAFGSLPNRTALLSKAALTYPRFPGLFGSIHLEQVPQFHASLV